jgi:AcrR family transcriptional regulator
MGRVKGARNLDYETTRRSIIDRIASSIFSTERHRMSFRELAHAGEVSPSTLRHYFRSREEVLEAALLRMRDHGSPYMAEGATADRGPAPKALRWFLRYLREGWNRGVGRAHAAGLSEGIGDPALGPSYLRHLLEPTLRSAEGRIALHVAAGELAPCDVRAAALELLAPLVLLLLHQESLGGCQVRPIDVDRFIDDHVDRFLLAHGSAGATATAAAPGSVAARRRGPGP